MVRQFADPHAFLRELVQNGIDAGAKRLIVTVDRDGDGIVRTAVEDDGTGMTRAIIEGPLLTLFQSSKETDSTKIGKYGVGFLSVFATKPERVEVRTRTGQAGEAWVLTLFPDHSFELARDDAPYPGSGSIVTLVMPMEAEAFEAHAVKAEASLMRWCRHAHVPILLNGKTINQPLDVDALVSVGLEENGARWVAGAGTGAQGTFIGFYNRGLTLFETAEPEEGLGGVHVKIDAPALAHTLSRDNVRRDAELRRVLRRAATLVRGPLWKKLTERIASAATEVATAPDAQRLEALDRLYDGASAVAFRRAGYEDVAVPLLEPIDGRAITNVDALLARSGAVIETAHESSPLTRALAANGELIVRSAALLPSLRQLTRERPIHDAETSWLVDGGQATAFDVPTPLPIKAVLRCADADVARAAQELADVAEKHVRSLARTMTDPPPAVRAATRILLCAKLARSSDAGDLEHLPLFPDTTGKRRLSLAEMRNAERTRVVTDPPPHPPMDDEPPVVFLWPAEKEVLARVARLTDVTASMREIVLGDQRRTAPQLSDIALDEETRRACLCVAKVHVGSLEGEVGLLAPARVGLRGIRLHHTRRPLITLPDDVGWPMVAVVNDDWIVPTRAFTGLASRDDAARIRNDLRAAILPRIAQLFDVPAGVLGVVRLPFPFHAQPGRVPCIGALWVERTWPERPEVHVEGPGHVDPFHVPRTVPGAMSDIVPVFGKVLVAGTALERDDALRDVFRHVQKRLGPIIAAAKRSPEPPSPEALASYEWELRMLGERSDRDPRAELAGDRPDEILLRVVARRAPSFLQLVETPEEPSVAPSADDQSDVEQTITDPRVPDFDFAPASSPPSFFEGLVRRIVELVTGPEPTKGPALVGALTDAIVAMKLTGSPVASVVEARRGRPVRFDAKTKQLFVNTRHEAVRAIVDDPARTLFLLAAAVSEVSRELEQVTDAEELNVIADLLRG